MLMSQNLFQSSEFINDNCKLKINFHDNNFVTGFGKFRIGKKMRAFSMKGIFFKTTEIIEIGLTTDDSILVALSGTIRQNYLKLSCLLKESDDLEKYSYDQVTLYS